MKPITILTLVALVLASCVSTERAARVLKKKGALANLCATEYPVRDSIVERTVTDTLRIETIRTLTDSILVDVIRFRDQIRYVDTCNEHNIGQPVVPVQQLIHWRNETYRLETYVNYLRDSLIRDATYKERTYYQRSTADSVLYARKYDEAQKKIVRAKNSTRIFMGAAGMLLLLLLVVLLVRPKSN